MIFGEIETSESYYDFYGELLEFTKRHFKNVESGLQGDAYIWITNEGEKVSLDTFSSMRFQIKADVASGSLVKEVINAVKAQYPVQIYCEPIPEGHENIEF
jgi:hypothetical protein